MEDKMGRLAKFKCLKCGFVFETTFWPTLCIKCWHDYVKWVNYDEMYRLFFRKEVTEAIQ